VRELQAHLAAIGAHLGIVLKVETILWLAEASHTPKDGMPSRAEVTDAAMSERAECVMLNKGPYVLDAVRTLDDILKRMQGHQHKKSSRLRELGLARRFLNP
jgi:pyruvate kinase